VIGGGFYSDFAAMTASEAWALFEEGNGAASLSHQQRVTTCGDS
jgi:hypothetical protein